MLVLAARSGATCLPSSPEPEARRAIADCSAPSSRLQPAASQHLLQAAMLSAGQQSAYWLRSCSRSRSRSRPSPGGRCGSGRTAAMAAAEGSVVQHVSAADAGLHVAHSYGPCSHPQHQQRTGTVHSGFEACHVAVGSETEESVVRNIASLIRLKTFRCWCEPAQRIFAVSGDACVTAADVAAEQSIAAAAEGRGELTGLALWLLAERQKVGLLSGVIHAPSGLQTRYWCGLKYVQHVQAGINTTPLVFYRGPPPPGRRFWRCCPSEWTRRWCGTMRSVSCCCAGHLWQRPQRCALPAFVRSGAPSPQPPQTCRPVSDGVRVLSHTDSHFWQRCSVRPRLASGSIAAGASSQPASTRCKHHIITRCVC